MESKIIMSQLVRIVLVVVTSLLLILALAGAGLVGVIRQAFPQTEGTLLVGDLISAAGSGGRQTVLPSGGGSIGGRVEILRDKNGIPHVYADSPRDLFFGQGFVHAQDRFFQMEFYKRIGAGRLSELFGKGTLGQDRFIRTVGWRRIAEKEAEALPADVRALLQAYADGVNAYALAPQNRDKLGVEFKVLGLIGRQWQPEPWSIVDSIAWGKVMAWNLSGGGLSDELAVAALLDKGGRPLLDAVLPPFPQDAPVILPDFVAGGDGGPGAMAQGVDSGLSAAQALALMEANLAVANGLGMSQDSEIGSNNWVVHGSRTATGKPLLANDPHLGLQLPAIWYANGLHCRSVSAACPFDVTGVSFPAAPGVIIGHNARIAWGVTNLGPDVVDLVMERPNPGSPDEFEYQGRFEPAEVIEEKITVAGSDPVTVRVRVTRNGPIISDVVDDARVKAQPVALRYTGNLVGSLFQSVVALNKAQNWAEFRDALRKWDIPAQNFVYADVDGNIGYQAPGRIPIRSAGDGTQPVPGWTGEYEWKGFIDFDKLPMSFNPPRGYIVTANNAVVDKRYQPSLGTFFDYGYRAARITELIEAKDKLTADDMKAIQADVHATHADAVLPRLGAIPQPDDPLTARAWSTLRSWDRQYRPDSAGAAVFEVFWNQLALAVFADELGPDLAAARLGFGVETRRAVQNVLGDGTARWWDDVTTAGVEARDAIIAKALRETAAVLRKRFGTDDVAQWRWGDLHQVTMRNQTLGTSGIAPVEALFNRGPKPVAGAGAAVNNISGGGSTFSVAHGPSMRMVHDLSDLGRSWVMLSTGQSGHTGHPHYDDFIAPWIAVAYVPLLGDRAAVERSLEGRLVLEP